MEKFPKSNENVDTKEWFNGVQEELEKERAKTQEDYDKEEAQSSIANEGPNTKEWFNGVQEELEKERAKTQEDYDKESE
ncbi:hypothetical protein IKE97_03215 [Candidatus Saccharibacteria bacterium]|nr:hypothetical protein [Candidatus Saccharibacteria bacterium]